MDGLVLLWIGSLVAGIIVGNEKGITLAGIVLCLVFGPLGFLAVGFLPESPRSIAKRQLLVEQAKEKLRADRE